MYLILKDQKENKYFQAQNISKKNVLQLFIFVKTSKTIQEKENTKSYNLKYQHYYIELKLY